MTEKYPILDKQYREDLMRPVVLAALNWRLTDLQMELQKLGHVELGPNEALANFNDACRDLRAAITEYKEALK